MSMSKRPLSLRHHFVSARSGVVRSERLSIGSNVSAVAIACIAASVGFPVLAQDYEEPPAVSEPTPEASPEASQLPKLTVETTAKKPKKTSKPAKTVKKKTAPVAPPAPQPVEASSESGSGPAYPGANPYADGQAAYKVNSSANGKFTEKILNTPRTITTVPKEVLEDTQTTSVRELARTTPGVTLGFGEGGAVFGDNLYIRGFRANNDAYIDGVRDPGTSSRETFNVEQVEILKGPSSTIGGRGTTGGALNIITKKPQDEDFAIGAVTVGTDNTKRTTLDVNYAIDPTFAVRANGMWQNADVAGRDDVYDDRWGGAISAQWKPTHWFKLIMDYSHLDLDQMPDWGVPYANAFNGNNYNGPWTEYGLDRKNFYGIPGRDFTEGQQDIATLTNELKFSPDTKLTTKLRLGQTDSAYVVSAPGRVTTTDPDPSQWTVSSSAKSNYQRTDVAAIQSDLNTKFFTGAFEHAVVAGVEASREKVRKDSYRNLDTESFNTGNIPGCTFNLWNPGSTDTTSCWGPADELVLAGNPTKTQIDSQAAYILDTIKITEDLRISGGIRVDHYDISRDTFTSSLSRQDTMFNWNAGIVYNPLPNGALYASVATSTNPMGQEIEGGAGDYGGLDPNAALLDPEENTAYEVGTKWELFSRKLLVTAALFQTTKENARESFNGTYVDTGEYRVRGIDIGFAGKVTDALSLYGGAVFMDSEVLESVNAANVGKKLANINHNTFNLLAKYQVTEALSIGAQATYKSEIALGTLAENGRWLPSSWRYDLMAEYEFSDNVELQLNLNNLTDEIVYDAGYRSGSPFVYIGPGRVGYAMLKFKY